MQADRALIDARERAIAVELDLVQPVVAVGHARRRRRELRPHLLRQRLFSGAGQRPTFSRIFALRLRGSGAGAGSLVLEELLDPAAAQHALGPLRRAARRPAPGRANGSRSLISSQLSPRSPVLGLEPDQHPAAAELLAVQAELERALAIVLLRVAHRRPSCRDPRRSSRRRRTGPSGSAARSRHIRADGLRRGPRGGAPWDRARALAAPPSS